jgi:glycerophosphoryl diester phosphodiesterase
MAHARGLEVHVWTINEPTQMKRLLEMGVDGIVTDRCDLARAIVDGVATP